MPLFGNDVDNFCSVCGIPLTMVNEKDDMVFGVGLQTHVFKYNPENLGHVKNIETWTNSHTFFCEPCLVKMLNILKEILLREESLREELFRQGETRCTTKPQSPTKTPYARP